jgi:hypothetical protein
MQREYLKGKYNSLGANKNIIIISQDSIDA